MTTAILILRELVRRPFERRPVEYHVMASREPGERWHLQTQAAGSGGVRQHTRECSTWAELVERLEEIGGHAASTILREAISYALEDEDVLETGALDDARWWAQEQRTIQWVETNPGWLHEHHGDVTIAVAAYLARFVGEDVRVELIDPDPEAFMPDRVQGSYRITDTDGLDYPPTPGGPQPWTIEIDVAVDGAGEVFGRVRSDSFRSARS